MMLKGLVLLLITAAACITCSAQQYFTGSVEYKSICKDTAGTNNNIQVAYGTSFIHYTAVSGCDADTEGSEAVLDWNSGSFYMIEHYSRRIFRIKLKSYPAKSATTVSPAGSTATIAGVKAKLYKISVQPDMELNAWYADSLLTRMPDSLSYSNDLSFFAVARVLLKIEFKKPVWVQNSGVTGFIAQKITPLPAGEMQYQLPPGYPVTDEDEAARQQDSVMQAFKAIDSSLSASDNLLERNADSVRKSRNHLIDSITRSANAAHSPKQPGPAKRKKTAGTRQKRAARKP